MAEEEEAGGEERPSMAQFSALTTYSDLITLMASFFLLMFMIALQEQSKAKATMETVMEAVARQLGARQPRGPSARPPEASHGAGGPAEGEMRHGPPGKSPDVRSLTDDERQRLSFGDRLLFKAGSTELTAREQHILQTEVAPEMRGFNNRIEVRGHTADIDDEGSPNLWKLGYDRAYAVMEYLVKECGLEANRFQLTSFADGESLRRGDPEADRRVEIIMSEARVESHSGQ